MGDGLNSDEKKYEEKFLKIKSTFQYIKFCIVDTKMIVESSRPAFVKYLLCGKYWPRHFIIIIILYNASMLVLLVLCYKSDI